MNRIQRATSIAAALVALIEEQLSDLCGGPPELGDLTMAPHLAVPPRTFVGKHDDSAPPARRR